MWNSDAKVIDDVTVIGCFNQIVETFGSCDAIQNYPNNQTISYKELQQQAISIASQLHFIIFGTQEFIENTGVVLCVEEGPEMVILVMAFAYAGLFYVPVELNKTPSQRVSFIANDCGSKVCIGWKCDSERIPTNMQFICAEELLAIHESSSSAYQPKITSSTPLYAIYTSGSTGEPKGVMMNHGNLAIYSRMKGSDEHISKADNSHVLLASAFTFDLCQGDIYTTLLNGATLITAHRSALLNDLRKVLTNTKSTHITLTPSLFGLLDANEQVADVSSSNSIINDPSNDKKTSVKGPLGLPHLKSVCLGGEPMTSKMIQVWGTNESKHQLTLRNLYGATEATVHQTRSVIYPDSRCNDIGVPIGYTYDDVSDIAMGLNGVGVFLASDWSSENTFTIIPPPSVSSSLANSHSTRLVSEPGEIVIFGPTVANNYLNRVEMSSSKFPITERFGKVFRTGDLGHWVVDKKKSKVEAHFELIGRMEEGLVKVNGQRVELGEVVSTLESAEIIKKAIVLKLPKKESNDGQANEEESVVGDNLVAVLVLIEGEVLDEHTVSALMALCELTLPLHMIPRRFGCLTSESQFPLTHSGKVDQRKLMNLVQDKMNTTLKPEGVESDSFNLHVFSHAVRETPQGELERCVAGVWEQVLGLEVGSVGRYDSFTALGGDSLAALRASRMLALRTKSQHGMNSYDSTVEAVVGDEQGLVDGEAALYIHGGRVPSGNGEGEACMFGITMGPLAPCELEKQSVLLDYAQFLSKHNITPLLNEQKISETSQRKDKDDEYITPTLRALCSGVSMGRVSLVKTLLHIETEKKIIKNIHDEHMFTPIHIASSSSHVNATLIMKLLVESSLGSKWAQTSTEAGTTPLHICAARGGETGQEMVALLLRAGSDINVADADKCTALHLASRIGDHKIVDMLLTWCDENIDKQCEESACEGGMAEQLIIKHDDNIKSQLIGCVDRWERSALDWTMLNNHRRVFQVLVSHGADASSCPMSNLFNNDLQSETQINDMNDDEIVALDSSYRNMKDSMKRSHGSSDPAHVSRKLSSDIDTLIVLISIVKKYQTSIDEQEVAAMETAVSSIRNLVCTSNLNREGAREHGAIKELVFLVNRYFNEIQDHSILLLKLTISCVGVLRNLSYGNENNRIAIVEAGGVDALMRLLPHTPKDFQSISGEVRNLTFTTASALCNIAMSSVSHGHILSTPDALVIIETVLGLPSRDIGSEVGGESCEVPTTSSDVQTRPHPGLTRLRDTFQNRVTTSSSTTSRYSNHRIKKQESITESLKTLIFAMEEKYYLILEIDKVEEGKMRVVNYGELEDVLQDFITLVKSNNKNRTIARESGAITALLNLLQQVQSVEMVHSTNSSVLLKLVECVACLSHGNEQNRLDIFTRDGIDILAHILEKLVAESNIRSNVDESVEVSSTLDSFQFKFKFSLISALCNLAMSDTTHQQMMTFPIIFSVIEQMVKDHNFSHPALTHMYEWGLAKQ